MRFHPGCTELEWLSDLKTIAERVGADVLGKSVRWRVETRIAARRNRSDVLIESDDGTLLLSGEAKRPDDPAGVHALVDAEVNDAISKAQSHGVPPSMSVDEAVLGFFSALTASLLDPLHREFHATRATLSPRISERALRAGLSIQNDQDCRYLVAQGIFEVLSASQFYRVTQDFFPLDPILSGTSPQRGPLLPDILTRNLREAVDKSGDYESVLAVAAGTAGTDWAPSAVFTAALGFVAAACIWWVYFDHVGSSGIELGPQPAFYWGYGHLAVYAGFAAFGVGTQLAVEAAGAGGAHAVLALGAGAAPSGGDYGLGARLALGGGLALYLAGIAFVDRVNEGARNGAVLPARLGAAALLLGLSFAGSPLSPLAFIASVVAVLLALTAFETLRPSPRFPAVPTPGFGTGTVPGEFWQSS